MGEEGRGRRYRRLLRLVLGRESRMRSEVDEEVRFHLERKVEKLVAGGLSREEAEAEARRRFGDVEELKERMLTMRRRSESRSRRGERVDAVRLDLRFALRQLRTTPMFTAVAVITLALGIGATTAIFSVVDGIVFRPLPYDDSRELVAVWLDVTRRGGPVDEWPNYPDIHDLRERSRTLEAIGLWGGSIPTLTGRGEPEQLRSGVVSGEMLSEVLRVEPELGRGFSAEDDRPGAAPTALLSHGLWQRAFGGDASVVGSTITLNGTPTTVLGVMPADFRPPFVPDAELWTPLGWDLADNGCGRGGYCVRAIARMADGASLEEARREATAIGGQLEAEHPEANVGRTFFLRPLREDLVGPARTSLLVLLAAAGLVLLIACVNVANLLLVRGTSRRGELAVRSAMGAGRGRLVSQLLVESVVLALVGGGLGIGLAFGLTDALVALAPAGTPRLEEVAVDGRVLGFAAGASLLAGLLFGILPALRSAGRDLHDTLREGGRGADRSGGARARSGLVVAQVALALVLLVGAGLLVRSFQNLRSVEMGFRAEGVLVLRVGLPQTRYPDRAAVQAFYPRLLERLAALPGVDGAGATTSLPLAGFDSDVNFNVEGRPVPPAGQETTVWYRRVTPGYLETVGTPIVRGRGILPSDRDDGADVVVVNETFVRRFFPADDPIGKRINLGNPDQPTWREIVGVARDVRHFGVRGDSRAALYLPFDQAPANTMFVVLHSAGVPSALAAEARGVLAREDPLLAAGQVRPLSAWVGDALGQERLVAMLLGLFAALALILAVVGLYGVVSYSVSSRLREMGVRLALGASGGQVSGLVVRRSLLLVGVGLVIGLAGSFALTRLLGSLLFGVSATDPATFLAVTVALSIAAFAASAVPAVRAGRVDPVEVLRSE